MERPLSVDSTGTPVKIHPGPGNATTLSDLMAHLYFKHAHWIRKYQFLSVIVLCWLSACYMISELLADGVPTNIIGLTRGNDKPILIYGTNLFFASSIPCGGQPLELLILIASRPDRRDVRDVIRTTWLRQVAEHNLPVRHVFMVGRAPTWSLRQLREEQERHGDLAVFDFRDTYRNLTRKTLLGLDWAWQTCPQVQYVMKADDDTYVNVTNVLNLLALEVPSRPYMVGTVRSMRAPNRVKGHKYYMSEGEYTSQFYPSYCDGASYVIPIRMAQDVVRVTKEGLVRPVLTLEDVHVGRCVGQLGYGLRHRNALNVNRQFALHHPRRLCSSTVASVHPVTMEEVVGIWNNCTGSAHSSDRQV